MILGLLVEIRLTGVLVLSPVHDQLFGHFDIRINSNCTFFFTPLLGKINLHYQLNGTNRLTDPRRC